MRTTKQIGTGHVQVRYSGEPMQIFELEKQDYIELNNLLKLIGLCPSGGIAKLLIADGQVRVDGEVELRKRCKIRDGQVVELDGQQVSVIQSQD